MVIKLSKKTRQIFMPAMLLIAIINIFFVNKTFSQDKKAQTEFIVSAVGFYNVENLFDTINDPDVLDEEFTPEGKNRWNSKKYLEKIDNLSTVIEKLGQEYIPDGLAVLGLSEVENKSVLEDLVNSDQLKDRNYQIVHYDSKDRRGIDVVFLYNPKYFKYISSVAYPTILKNSNDFRARDQVILTGELLGERVHLIVGHWPSRAGGEKRTRPLRNGCAEVAKHVIDSIMEVEPGAKIFMLGDLNDNPDNKSISHFLNAKGKMDNLKDDELYNPFYELYKKGIGSNAYRDSWSLFDQIIVNPALVGNDRETLKLWKPEVFNRPFLVQPSGRFQGYPFRSFAGGAHLGGYSDHFPVIVYLIREKK